MLALTSNAALLVIDVQRAIDDPKWGLRNNPQAEQRIAVLLDAWRRATMPILHVRHDSREPGSPYRPGMPGNAFKLEALPRSGEPIVAKQTNSAFIDTDLEARLAQGGMKTLVVCGALTHITVEATVRHAGNLGFRVLLPADACWAVEVRDLTGRLWPAEDVHQLSLAVMQGEYATVTETKVVLAALAAIES